jgi:hypothetical protein
MYVHTYLCLTIYIFIFIYEEYEYILTVCIHLRAMSSLGCGMQEIKLLLYLRIVCPDVLSLLRSHKCVTTVVRGIMHAGQTPHGYTQVEPPIHK